MFRKLCTRSIDMAAGGQGVNDRMHALDLRFDMSASPRMTGLHLPTALVVRSLGLRPMLARVDHCDRDLAWKPHGRVVKGVAIEHEHVPAAAQCGSEMVQNSNVHSRCLLLRHVGHARGASFLPVDAELAGAASIPPIWSLAFARLSQEVDQLEGPDTHVSRTRVRTPTSYSRSLVLSWTPLSHTLCDIPPRL